MVMEISKSSRHSKITGDFAERLVLYWLSKYGFECSYVDHTGIDIIARNPHTKELMGISVKSRCRNIGKEETYVALPKKNFVKVEQACKAFGCIPYFAIVVDAGATMTIFILSMAHLFELHPAKQRVAGWYMRKKHLERYMADPEIQIVRFGHETLRWWGRCSSSGK
jgi:Holliday junction resolvase-like predicted endonuclease